MFPVDIVMIKANIQFKIADCLFEKDNEYIFKVGDKDGETLGATISKDTKVYVLAKDTCGQSQETYITLTVPESLKLDTWSADVTEVCHDVKTDINLAISGGTKPYTYRVNSDEAVKMGETESTATIKEAQGTYSVSVTDANGCSVSSETDVVITNPSSFTVGTLSDTNTDICKGGEIPTITVSGSKSKLDCDDCISYVWTSDADTEDPKVKLSETASFKSTKTEVGVYKYTVTVSDKCSNTSNDLHYTLSISGKPTVSLLGSVADICQGSAFDLTSLTKNVVDNQNTITAEGWKYRKSGAETWLDYTPDTPVSDAGTYEIKYYAENSCGGTYSEATVTANVDATSYVEFADASVSVCPGNDATVTLQNVVGDVTAYIWKDKEADKLPATITAGKITQAIGDGDVWHISATAKNGTCSASEPATATMSASARPSVTITETTALCKDGDEEAQQKALLTANATGVTYNWYKEGAKETSLGTKNTLEVAEAGTYHVEVSMGENCTNSISHIVSANSKPSVSLSYDKVCEGKNTTLNANATGVTYKWDSETEYSDKPSITVSSDNKEHTVYVKDSKGCVNSDSKVVEFNELPQPVIEKTYADDYLCNDGIALALRTSEEYTTYKWSTAEVTREINVSAAGKYTVTVTDGNGCKNTSEEHVVILYDSPALNDVDPQTVCEGSPADFTLTIKTATTGDYKYTVDGHESTDATDKTKFTLGKGTHKAVVTDKYGCPSGEIDVVVSEYLAPVIGDVTVPAICAGTEGVTLTAPSVTWNDANENNTARKFGWYVGDTEVTSDYIKDLAAGTHTLTYKVKNECTKTEKSNFTLTVNANPTVAMSAVSDCDKNTTLTAAGDNGTTPYTYAWSNDGVAYSEFATTDVQPVSKPDAWAEGQLNVSEHWWVKVKDKNGCVSVDPADNTATIYRTPSITLDPESQTICKNQSAEISYSNLIGSLNSFEGLSHGTGKFTTESPLTESKVFDIKVENGTCDVKPFQVTVGVYDDFVPGAIVLDSKTICANSAETITIGESAPASGGNGAYSYQWYVNGTEIDGATSATYTIDDAYKNTAGNYDFTREVSDGKCSTTPVVSTNTYTLNVSAVPAVMFAEENYPTCAGNDAEIEVKGISGSVSVIYSENADYSSPKPLALSSDNKIKLTVDKNYYIKAVATAEGCSDVQATTMVTATALPTVTLKSDYLCVNAGGTISDATITATEGFDSYTWYKDGVKLDGKTTNAITTSEEGSYKVEITQGSCSNESSPLVLNKTASPVVTENFITGSVCPVRASNAFGSHELSVTASDAVAGEFSYLWTGVSSSASNTAKITSSCDATHSYSVTVTNATTKCYTTVGGEFTIQAPTLTFEKTSYDDVKLSATGCSFSIPDFTQGDNAMKATSACVGNNYDSSEIAYVQSDNAGGDYSAGSADRTITVTMSATDFCTTTPVEATRKVIIPAKASITNVEPSQPKCFGEENGSMTITATGEGELKYAYKEHSASTYSEPKNSSVISGLGAGFYDVKVIDGNGCPVEHVNTEVKDPDKLVLSGADAFVCNGQTTSIKVTASGGTVTAENKYTFSLAGKDITHELEATFDDLDGTSSGKAYIFTVKDANNCEAEKTITVTQRDNITVTLSATEDKCDVSPTVTFTPSLNDATKYEFSWNGGAYGSDNSQTLKFEETDGALNYKEATWTVQVRDKSNDCMSTVSAPLTGKIYRKPTISFTVPTNACAVSAEDYEIVATVNGYTDDASYSWSGDAKNVNDTKTTITKSDCAETYRYSLSVVSAGDKCNATDDGTFTTTISAPVLTKKGDIVLKGTDCNFVLNSDSIKKKFSVESTCGNTDDSNLTWSYYSNAEGTSPVTLSDISETSTIYVKVAYKCSGDNTESALVPVTVTFPSKPAKPVLTPVSSCSNVDNGEIVVTEVADITYTMAGHVYDEANHKFSGLSAGSYTVVATDTNGCINGDDVTIANYDSYDVTAENITKCYSEASSLTFSASVGGVTDGYEFHWVKGAVDQTTAPSITSTNVGKETDTWSVYAIDSKGCKSNVKENVTLTINPTPRVELNSSEKSCEENIEFKAVASGGTSPYTYKWDGSTTAEGSDSKTFYYSSLTDAEVSKLETHSVVVVDDNGCESESSGNKTATIFKKPVLGAFTITDKNTDGTIRTGYCASEDRYGVGATFATGTNAGYTEGTNTYVWTPDGTEIVGEGANVKFKRDMKKRCGGEYKYTLQVTNDKSGCSSDITPGRFYADLEQPTINATPDPIELTSGSECKYPVDFEKIKTNIKFEIADCLFEKDNTYEFRVGSKDGELLGADATISAETKVYVLAKDTCGSIDPTNHSRVTYITLQVPEALKLDTWAAAGETEVCYNETADINLKVSGGTAPYSYKVTGDETATEIADKKAEATISRKQGIYSVSVTDANGCSVSSETDVVITNPSTFTVGTLSEANTSVCEKSANPEVEIIGAVSASKAACSDCIEYKWVAKDKPEVTIGTDAKFTSSETTVGKYEYLVTVYDKCSNKTSDPFVYTHVINERPVITAQDTKVLCYNATAEIEPVVSKGKPTYKYAWTKADDASYSATTAKITTSAEDHKTVTYSLVVTDDNSCVSDKVDFQVEQPTSPITHTVVDVKEPSAYGKDNASYTVTLDGGYGSFKYCITDKFGDNCTPSELYNGTSINETGLVAGTYYIKVVDDNDCPHDFSVNVPSPSMPDVNVVHSDALCMKNSENNGNEGTITITSISGKFTMEMTDGSKSVTSTYDEDKELNIATFTGLEAGEYEMKFVLDADNSVTTVVTETIGEPATAVSFDLAYSEEGVGSPCTYNYSVVDLKNVAGGTPYTTVIAGDNFNDKYLVEVLSKEAAASYSSDKDNFTLSGDVKYASLKVKLTDGNGCIATREIKYTPAIEDLHITCENFKGIVLPLDDRCKSDVNISALDVIDSVSAKLCAPNDEIIVEYALDGSSFNPMSLDPMSSNHTLNHTLTNDKRSETITWKFSTNYDGIGTTCTQKIEAVDDKAPVMNDLNPYSISYQGSSKTCGADYDRDANNVKELLGVKDCSLKEVSWCLKKSETDTECIEDGTVYDSKKSTEFTGIKIEDLHFGDYVIVYTAKDDDDRTTSKVEKLTVVDDVKPSFECVPNNTLILDERCEADSTITFQDFAKDYLFKAGVIDTVGGVITDKTTTGSGVTYKTDGSGKITEITDECGDPLTVEYKTNKDASVKELNTTDLKVELSSMSDKVEIEWTLVDASPNKNRSESCTTTITPVDTIRPDVSAVTLADKTINYSETPADKCSAKYKTVESDLKALIFDKVFDCSKANSIDIVIRDKDGNVVASKDNVYVDNNGTAEYSELVKDLKHGDYKVEYTITDKSPAGNKSSITQNLNVKDDIAPDVACNNDDVINVPVGVECDTVVKLDFEKLLFALRAEAVLGTSATDESGNLIKYESSDSIQTSIFNTEFNFSDDQKKAMKNDCDEALTTKVVVATKDESNNFVADGDTLRSSSSMSIKYKEEKQVTIVIADASGNPVECVYRLVGAPQILKHHDLDDETEFKTKKDDSGKEECSYDYSKTFEDVYREIYKQEYKDCSPVSELKYTITDSKDSDKKIDGSIKPTESFSELLVPGDYTIEWNAVGLDGTTTNKVDEHEIKVTDGVAPEIACPDTVRINLTAECNVSIDMDLHQLALGHLKDKITVGSDGVISAKNSGDENYFSTSETDGHKTITNIYDDCGMDLTVKVSGTEGVVGDVDKMTVSFDQFDIDNNNLKKNVYWTLNDGTNNSKQCKTVVKAEDVTPPTIATSLKDMELVADNKCEGKTTMSKTDVIDLLKVADCSGYDITYKLMNTDDTYVQDGDKDKVFIIGESNAITVTDGQTIEWFATDRSEKHNTSSVTQKVVVKDMTAPDAVCNKLVPDVVVTEAMLGGAKCIDSTFLKSNGLLTLENIDAKKQYITDNCSPYEDITKVPTRYFGDEKEDMGAPFKVGETQIQWVFTDKAGNANNFCTQTITIPNIAPEIACPDTVIEIAVDYDKMCLATTSTKSEDMVEFFRKPILAERGIDETSADYDSLLHHSDCGSKLSVENDRLDQDVELALGKTETVKYTIKDELGNTTTCKVTYKGVDKDSPVLTLDAVDTLLNRGNDCKANYELARDEIYTLLDIKDCTEKLTIEYSINGGEKVKVNNKFSYDFAELLGDNTVTWYVSDGINPVSKKDQKVTVTDTLAPDYVCPTEPIKVYVGDDCKNTDVISAKQMLINLRADAVLTPKGSSYWGTPESMLGSRDMDKISHDCQDSVLVNVKDGSSFTSFENISLSLTRGESKSYEFEVTDGRNAFESCVVTFVAVDTTAPKADRLHDFLIYSEAGRCSADYEATLSMMKDSLHPTDNCTAEPTISYVSGNDTIKLTDENPFKIKDLMNKASQEITWVVSDESGNKVVRKQTVVVKDTVPPAVDCDKYPTLTYVLREHNKTVSIADFRGLPKYAIEDQFDDLCDGLLDPKIERLDGKSFTDDIYDLDETVGVKISFTDLSDNTSYCQTELVVKDSVHPEIICPMDYQGVLACTNDNVIPEIPADLDYFKTYIGGKVLTERNVTGFKVEDSMEGTKCSGAVVRTYTIYDRFRDSSVCVNKFAVKDTLRPTWVNKLVGEFPVIACHETLDESILPTDLSAVDNCGAATVKYAYSTTQSDDATECSHYNYEHIYTYYAVDECGLSTVDSVVFKIIVRDTIAPTFDLPESFIDSVISVQFKKECIFEMMDITGYPYNLDDNCAAASVLKVSQTPEAGTHLHEDTNAVISLTDVCGNKTDYTKKIIVPNRKVIVDISSHDEEFCEGSRKDLNLLSSDLVPVHGNYWYYDPEVKEFVNRISLFSYDVFKEQIDNDHVIWSNNRNMPYYRKFFTSDKAERDSIKNVALSVNNVTHTGTYFIVATDTLTGCKDTTSFFVKVMEKPRVAMATTVVESCENLPLPISGPSGEYVDIYNVCVDDMGSPITNSGWILNDTVYAGRPVVFGDDGVKLVYYAENECGVTRSDSSKLWSCDYSYNELDGTFVSDTTVAGLLRDSSSNALELDVREQILPEKILLTSNPSDKPRVWAGDPVDLKVTTHYSEDVELLWYKVNGQFDAVSGKFDGYGNVVESYLNPLDERDELIGTTNSYEEFFKNMRVNSVQDTTLFYVVATDNVCSSAASNVVEIDAYDFIPTAFTPHNSIGMNDVFMKGFKVEIYNRYGNLVFSGNDGWDGMIRGQLADPTVYYYVVTRERDVRKGTIEVVYFK